MVYETRRVQGMSGVPTLSLTGSGDWAEGGSMGEGGRCTGEVKGYRDAGKTGVQKDLVVGLSKETW